MNTLLYQLIAIATSLVLAVPPGSCGGFMQHGGAGSAPVKQASCCHETAPERPCNSGNSPSKPSVKCCCERDVALPEKSAQTTDSLDVAFAIVADHVPMNVGTLLSSHAAVFPVHSGPRLQILLCVWRC